MTGAVQNLGLNTLVNACTSESNCVQHVSTTSPSEKEINSLYHESSESAMVNLGSYFQLPVQQCVCMYTCRYNFKNPGAIFVFCK